MQPVSEGRGTTSIYLLESSDHNLFASLTEQATLQNLLPWQFRSLGNLPTPISENKLLTAPLGKHDCGPSVGEPPWLPASLSSTFQPSSEAFLKAQDGESRAGALLLRSPVGIIASGPQPLGRLLVEPADVMGHGFPIRGVGLLLPPLPAPAAAVGTGAKPILKS